MAARRTCKAIKKNGDPCRAAPLQGSDYCPMHDPEHAKDMTEARRMGGLRQRRERTLTTAYNLEGLDNVGGLRRLLDIATKDLVALENSVPRDRALINAVSAGAKLLETGELDERIEALEAVHLIGRGKP